MKGLIRLSWANILAIAFKEFIKVRSDPTSLGMILALPLFQIVFFGYSIEYFPKHLPTALVSYDESPFTQRLIQSIETTDFFNIIYKGDAKTAEKLLKEGKLNYIFTVPAFFSYDLIKERKPHVLLEVDTSVPGTMGVGVQVLDGLKSSIFERYFQGSLAYLAQPKQPFNFDVHPLYNPELKSTYMLVPGLIGVIMMLSLSLVASMTIIEEKEFGSINVLLNSDVRPTEIFLGKFLTYLVIGYIQLICILYLCGYLLFDIPLRGSFFIFLLTALPYLIANLMLGLVASTIAETQLQAQQIITFFFMPSFLITGFAFPFYAMPAWAQWLGNLLPLTHYIRIASGLMLKEYDWMNIMPELWPIILFAVIMAFIASVSFKKILK